MQQMTEAVDDPAAATAGSAGPEALQVLVARHSRPLFRLAYRMTGNAQDAEDLVQETFLRAHRALPRFEARAQPSTWLYRICANAALDLLRKRRTHGVAPSLDDPEGGMPEEALTAAGAGPERLLLSREAAGQLEAAMATLSPTERAAFALRHLEERSIAEIGEILGLRTAATKNTIFRGVRKLRRALEPWRRGRAC